MLEIGAKLFPRRYRRFKDLRPYQEACEWARTLNWRENPYDRFLLRRELLHHLEATQFHAGSSNVFTFASREEIAAEVGGMIEGYQAKHEPIGVFNFVLITVQWNLAYKHGRVRYSNLAAALGKMSLKEKGTS